MYKIGCFLCLRVKLKEWGEFDTKDSFLLFLLKLFKMKLNYNFLYKLILYKFLDIKK